MKLIRWWGLVAFFGILVLLGLTWYLVAPILIKNTIQDVGSEALGAKVEISNVELSLFPVSVAINQLKAADPDQPMQNIIESEQIKFSIDTGSLLWKKIVIDEMVLTGVKTATTRKESGALKGGRQTTQAIENAIDVILPDMSNINVGELVDKADLITLKRIDALKANQAKLKQEWQTALDKEAFEQRVATIKSEYERLENRAKKNKLNLIKDRKDWKKLKQSIDTERKQIASLSGKLQDDKKSLSNQFKSVKNGPNDDMQAIMNNMGVANGVEGLVDKYLGPQYTPWVTKAVELAKSFKPSDTQSTQEQQQAALQVGKKVIFNDQHIYPEILVKKIKLGGSNKGWELDGKGFDLGYLPWLTGNPAKLDIDLGGKGKAKLSIVSDWASAQKMSTKLNSSVTSWPLESMQFMQTEAGNWTLTSGNLTANIDGELTLEKINLTATFSIGAPKLAVPENISGWQKSLATSINNEQKIDFKLTANGSITDPKIKLDTSVEKLFKQAIGDKVKNEAAKLKGKVKQSITDKVGDISSLENFNENFDQWKSQMGEKDKLLENLLGKIKL
jgi:uncharacterized protein (TIGR03545 family)